MNITIELPDEVDLADVGLAMALLDAALERYIRANWPAVKIDRDAQLDQLESQALISFAKTPVAAARAIRLAKGLITRLGREISCCAARNFIDGARKGG